MGTGHRQVHDPVAEEVEVLGPVVRFRVDGHVGGEDGLAGRRPGQHPGLAQAVGDRHLVGEARLVSDGQFHGPAFGSGAPGASRSRGWMGTWAK